MILAGIEIHQPATLPGNLKWYFVCALLCLFASVICAVISRLCAFRYSRQAHGLVVGMSEYLIAVGQLFADAFKEMRRYGSFPQNQEENHGEDAGRRKSEYAESFLTGFTELVEHGWRKVVFSKNFQKKIQSAPPDVKQRLLKEYGEYIDGVIRLQRGSGLWALRLLYITHVFFGLALLFTLIIAVGFLLD